MLLQRALIVGILGLLSTGIGSASLILTDIIDEGGTGVGAVLTIVTAQGANGAASESGCVAWDGAQDVAASCAGAFEGAGGDEGNGASQTLTRELSELADLDNIADIALVYNVNETGGDQSVTLQDLFFTIFAADGTEIFTAFLDEESIVLLGIAQGTGTGQSGFTFILDDEQRALAFAAQEAQLGGFQSDWRVGGGFLATDFNSGPETLYVFRNPPAMTGVPEPATFVLFGAGLLAAGYLRRRRVQ